MYVAEPVIEMIDKIHKLHLCYGYLRFQKAVKMPIPAICTFESNNFFTD
jgi:hypothetical protein